MEKHQCLFFFLFVYLYRNDLDVLKRKFFFALCKELDRNITTKLIYKNINIKLGKNAVKTILFFVLETECK